MFVYIYIYIWSNTSLMHRNTLMLAFKCSRFSSGEEEQWVGRTAVIPGVGMGVLSHSCNQKLSGSQVGSLWNVSFCLWKWSNWDIDCEFCSNLRLEPNLLSENRSEFPKSDRPHDKIAQNFLFLCYILSHGVWRRIWQPTPVLLPGKSHGWGSLAGCSPWGCKESDMTEQLHFKLTK